MPPRDPHPADLGDTLRNVLFGFFGVVAAFLLLPKTLKLLVRRFLVRVIGEILLFVTFGLITEKLIDRLDDHPHAPARAGKTSRNAPPTK